MRKAELFLFLAARAQNVSEVICPLKRGQNCALRRLSRLTVAYQGFGHGLGEEDVGALSLYSADDIQPDLTLYLDVEPKVGLKRAKAASEGKVDRIEAQKMEFHQRVRDAFLRIAKKEPKRFKIVDAHLSKKQVFEQAVSLIEQYCSD